jgi:hypothetical protein
MSRRLVTILTVLSLLLCVGTAVELVLSLTAHWYRWHGSHGTAIVGFNVGEGWFEHQVFPPNERQSRFDYVSHGTYFKIGHVWQQRPSWATGGWEFAGFSWASGRDAMGPRSRFVFPLWPAPFLFFAFPCGRVIRWLIRRNRLRNSKQRGFPPKIAVP